MTVTLSLFAGVGAQFLDNNGNILSGGKVYTYNAGTTTPLATYTSNLGTVAQPNPIILDSAGRIPTGELWLSTGFGYKFVTQDANSVLIGTYDNVPSSAQPPIVNNASSIAYEQGNSTVAGAFIVGDTYLITSIGTTNFQLIGATSNTIGTLFIATGVGSGTGTAELSRTVQNRLQDFISVKDFGAVGNGIVDDTIFIQNAINSIISIGGTVYFPSGYYRVTSTIKVGKTIINNYTPLINRTVPASDALILSVTNSANYSYNQLNCVNISLISGGDVFFVADFSPSSPTPILEYNLSRESGRATKIEGSFSFIPISCFSGGKYTPTKSYVLNNLIGIAYPSQGCRNITNIFVASLTCGIFGISNYWVEYNNLEFTYCGDCLNIAQANAITVLNVLMTVSNRGIIYDGGASYIGSFHTESVANDLYVINAECTTFEAAYLEDSSTEDGTGIYAVTLGVDPSNPYNVIDCNFISIRVGAVRPNKKGYNLLNVLGSTFNACREYSSGIDANSTSRANLIGTDFNISAQLPLTRFSRWGGGFDNYFSFNFPGSNRPCIGIYEF